MLRIDENTYIDDSLVTCAEYQLFIDEMREQKKFFQPDHWTCWQFPVGQARTPILGVRFSDAQAFCKWLSRREEGKWRFRLPIADEAVQYPIQKHNEQISGFWIQNGYEHSFVWIGHAPIIDVRGIDFPHIFALDRTQNYTRANPIDFNLDPVMSQAYDHFSIKLIGNDLAFALAQIRNRDNWAIAQGHLNLNIARNLAITHILINHRIFGLELDRALDHDIAANIQLDIEQAFNLDSVLSVWINLITLQERIASRSPAFEGIRLVKERKPE